jgi:hypothetical protein
MATLSEVGPGSFAEYEGIRIVIPGLLTYGAVVAAFRTVAPSEKASLLDNPLTGIVAALTIGLLLYFLDIPARSAGYSKNQPTDYLNDKYPSIRSGELLTAYLLLLNTRMPSNTRNRALYMGSMYRIGVEMILALAFASSAVFGAALFNYGPIRGAVSVQAHRLGAAFLVVVFLLAVWANATYVRVKLRERLKKFCAGFWVWSMAVYYVGLVLVILPAVFAHFKKLPELQHHYVAVCGLAISVSYWNWRYIRGDAAPKSDREPLDSPFAGFLFLMPTILVLSIYLPGEKNVLSSTGFLAGWIAVAGLVVAMVVIRGHERKLHGVYRGQTRWLKDNSEEVSRFLGVSSDNGETMSTPLRVDIAVADVKVAPAQSGVVEVLRRLLASKH